MTPEQIERLKSKWENWREDDVRALLAEWEELQQRCPCGRKGCEGTHEKGLLALAEERGREIERLRDAGQRCMEISVGLAAAGIVGHQDILDVMGVALAAA